MKKLALVIVAGALFLPGSASAQLANNDISPAHTGKAPTIDVPELVPTCDGRTVRFHVRKAKKTIARAYAHRNWKDAHPFGKAASKLVRDHKRCIYEPRSARREIGKYRTAKLKSFRKYRQKQLQDEGGWCSPTPHPDGAGCWEIPVSIVLCESQGSWSAANPSGAVGPYQLLGWGAPFPVNTRSEAMAHHQIASRVWAGGAGRSNWVC